MEENKRGRPWTLTPEIIDNVVSKVPYGLRLHTIAGLAQVPSTTLDRWLKQGVSDMEEGLNTLCADLWGKFALERAKKVCLWLGRIELAQPNWQALWELVKAVCKEDFGIESEEYKELLETVRKLSESIKRIMDNPLHGVKTNGREVDSSSNVKE